MSFASTGVASGLVMSGTLTAHGTAAPVTFTITRLRRRSNLASAASTRPRETPHDHHLAAPATGQPTTRPPARAVGQLLPGAAGLLYTDRFVAERLYPAFRYMAPSVIPQTAQSRP
jgi:hypothetical protein